MKAAIKVIDKSTIMNLKHAERIKKEVRFLKV